MTEPKSNEAPPQIESMNQVWSPNNTVVVGADDHEIESLIDDLPFLQDYAAITGEITISNVAGQHVIGDMPEDLEHHALTVTRYSVRPVHRDPSEWTIEHYLNPTPNFRELVTHRAELVAQNLHHMRTQERTFITDDARQALHWKRAGMFEHAHQTVVITTDESIAKRWSDQGFFDHSTEIMLIEPSIDPERWIKDIPKGAAVLYTSIPDHTQQMLIHDKHVAGQLPPHLKHLAQSTTTWPHDHNTGTFGQPVTVRHHLVAKMTLPQ